MNTKAKIDDEVRVKGCLGIVKKVEFYSRRKRCPIFGKMVREPAPLIRYRVLFLGDDLEFKCEWFRGSQLKVKRFLK
jgi:hypothetical protein